MDLINEFFKRMGYLWYIMDPYDHMYEKVEEVPDYYKEITPAYISLIILEQIVRLFQGKNIMRLNDTVSNISQGILMELAKIPMHGVELFVYTWVYSNFRICTLPWDSVWTWLFCMVASDLCFYWAHRGVHQISILWLFHQTHHSSEEFNLTTPLRLSVFHNFSLWFTYVPLAFFVPPSIYLVHFQLSVIFQFWLHTEVIKSLGILEHIFVTPSHHRVHHGRNRRCIDKNFGSIFIFWDKIFGTFEPEGKEFINYGITKPLQSFGPLSVQFNHLHNIGEKLKTVQGFSNKISCLIKGPGWSPGKPWLGHTNEIPEPKENEQKYDPKLPKWLLFYVCLHTAALVIGHFLVILNLSKISLFTFAVSGSYMVLTTIGIGCILDKSVWGPVIEFIRCFLYFFIDAVLRKEIGNCFMLSNIVLCFFRYLFIISSIFWALVSPFVISISSIK